MKYQTNVLFLYKIIIYKTKNIIEPPANPLKRKFHPKHEASDDVLDVNTNDNKIKENKIVQGNMPPTANIASTQNIENNYKNSRVLFLFFL